MSLDNSEYIVPTDASEFVMTDNRAMDYPATIPAQMDLTANVTVRASEFDSYLTLDVTTEAGEGASLYLNREGALALIQAVAKFATNLT